MVTITFSVCLLLHSVGSQVYAQGELLNAAAYDRIVIKEKDGDVEQLVLPVKFPNGRPPAEPEPTQTLQIELVSEPGKRFEVYWRDIKSYRQFQVMLFEKAAELVEEQNFDKAFQYYGRLRKEYPEHPGLPFAIEEFKVKNAFQLFQSKEYALALGILESVRVKNPDRPGLDASISRVADKIVEGYVAEERYDIALKLIERFVATNQSNKFPFVANWIQKLTAKAEGLRTQSKKYLEQKNPREAYDSAKQMLRVYPRLSGGVEYYREMVRLYPLIQVGVTSASTTEPQVDTLTFGGLRDNRLFYRSLSEIVGYGAEGGEYNSPYGSLVRGIDGRSINVSLRARLTDMTGFALTRQLLEAGEVSPVKNNLQQLIHDVSVENIRDVQVALSQTHVRPEALLRFVPEESFDASQTNGPYRFLEVTDSGIARYVLNEAYHWKQPLQPKEIMQQRYSFTRKAIADLRSGKIDVVDRIFPANVDGLREDTSLVVDGYRTPTVHLLVPNYENPFMQNRNFRRAILYAINRADILNGRLMAGKKLEGTHVLNAAIPAGFNRDDPLAYGYNPEIEVRPYEPQMSAALLRLAEGELTLLAKEKKTDKPVLGKIVIGHPDSEISREAVEPIIVFLKRVGLKCEAKVVDAETINPADANVDLLYVELRIDEPLVDVPKMFRRYVATQHLSPAFRLGLRGLGHSRNWELVREQFVNVHRLAHDELPLIPLWQIRDHFVYSKSLSGLGYQPISLFQNIENWQSSPRFINEN